MKIALLTHSVNPRGGVVHCIELAHALHDAGHDVTLMAPARPGQGLFRPVRCKLLLVPVGPTPPLLREMVAERVAAFVEHLAPLAAGEGFDVWHAHDGIGGNALATLAERGLIEGYVRTVHHLDKFDDAVVMQWQSRSVRAASRVLCVSRLWQELLLRDHGIEAIEVANGVDAQRFQPMAEDDDDVKVAAACGLGPRDPNAPLVLAIGGIEPRKNTVRLLQAFDRLRQQRPGAQLVIVGGASLLDHDGYARSFYAALEATTLIVAPAAGANVHLAGTVLDAAMPALLRRADVLAMPSVSEGFGLVVLEALASGTPVVASRIAPFTEYLDDALAGREVHWADPFDVGSIADALGHALAVGHHDYCSGAVEGLCDRYGWGASATRHAAIYRATSHTPRPVAAPIDFLLEARTHHA